MFSIALIWRLDIRLNIEHFNARHKLLTSSMKIDVPVLQKWQGHTKLQLFYPKYSFPRCSMFMTKKKLWKCWKWNTFNECYNIFHLHNFRRIQLEASCMKLHLVLFLDFLLFWLSMNVLGFCVFSIGEFQWYRKFIHRGIRQLAPRRSKKRTAWYNFICCS